MKSVFKDKMMGSMMFWVKCSCSGTEIAASAVVVSWSSASGSPVSLFSLNLDGFLVFTQKICPESPVICLGPSAFFAIPGLVWKRLSSFEGWITFGVRTLLVTVVTNENVVLSVSVRTVNARMSHFFMIWGILAVIWIQFGYDSLHLVSSDVLLANRAFRVGLAPFCQTNLVELMLAWFSLTNGSGVCIN